MTTSSLIFVDARVNGYPQLIAHLPTTAEVVVLDSATDGLQQMADYLAGRTDIEAIHVVSHGSQGALYLGNVRVDGDYLTGHSAQLASIGNSLTETGDILLYGCNAAKGEAGKAFVNAIANLTGADIAASTDETGDTVLGGDWMLEIQTGTTETESLTGTASIGLLAQIIIADTTWGSGEIINLTGLVQIAPGITLTIEPGAVVNGSNQTIQVFGTLRAAGSASEKIDFNDTKFTFSSNYQTPGRIEISHAEVNGGAFLPATGNGSYGSFSVTDCNLTAVDGFYIWYPTSVSSFERNVFLQSDGLSIGVDGVEVRVTNNVFANHNGPAIENWASYGGTHVVVEHNSFLSTNLEALSLPEGYTSASMLAEHNYFGTTDLTNIATRVFDRTDSLNAASVIDYNPILTQAHADTPIWFTTNHAPAGNVKINGKLEQGRTLTATNTLADVDGLGTVGYQWNANGTAITGAMGSTYTLTQADVGKTISVTASYTDGQGTTEAITSAATAAVTSTVNTITGDSSNNVLLSTVGDDAIDGGAGIDTVSYANATAAVNVTLASNTEQNTGGAGIDTLLNIENLTGSKYNDTLTGNVAANVLNGGAGADTMTGGNGNDTYYVNHASDVVNEVLAGGTDTVFSTLLAYTLRANVEKGVVQGTVAGNLTGNALANTLTGNTAANQLNGGAGNDTLNGNGGNDILTGGAGKDVLTGGAGNDVFKFNTLAESGLTATTRDVITDFVRGQDKIDLSTIDANTALAGNQAFTGLIGANVAFTKAGQLKLNAGVLYGNTDADVAAEFSIALTGITTLTNTDFVL